MADFGFPDPGYLDMYAQDALKEMEKEELLPQADRMYEEFAHIQGWDEVVSYAAEMRVELDRYQFKLGDLVNFSCPRKQAGRPKKDDEMWNISSLANAIGEDRSTLSQLANNALFWHPGIREELPPQVSWRQLARARVDSGWRPGQSVTHELLTKALRIVLDMADGIYLDKKKAELTPLHYAKRISRAAEKALVINTDREVNDLFLTIFESAEEIIEILPEEGEDANLDK